MCVCVCVLYIMQLHPITDGMIIIEQNYGDVILFIAHMFIIPNNNDIHAIIPPTLQISNSSTR